MNWNINNVSSKVLKTSNAAKWWATESSFMTWEQDGIEYAMPGVPVDFLTRVLLLSSSTGEGEGSTNYATKGWASLLAGDIAPLGMTMMNRGVGGDDTTDAKNRFKTDVLPYLPDVVLLAFTLGNEGWVAGGGIGANFTAYDRLKDHLFELAAMCQRFGVAPVIVSQFSNLKYDADYLEAALQLNNELEREGFASINLMGACLDLSTGKPYALSTHDNLHYNDMGHNALRLSVNPYFIKKIAALRQLPYQLRAQTSPRGAVRYPASVTDAAAGDAIMYTPDYETDAFTVGVWVKQTVDQTGAVTILGFGNAGWRLTNNAAAAMNPILKDAAGGTAISSTVDLNDKAEHHIAVSYSEIGKEVKMYIDGVLIGTKTNVTIDFNQLGIGCRGTGTIYPANMEFRDVAVYRTRLTDNQVKDLYRGRITTGALDIYCPMDDTQVSMFTRFTNYAPTNAKLKCKTAQLIVV